MLIKLFYTQDSDSHSNVYRVLVQASDSLDFIAQLWETIQKRTGVCWKTVNGAFWRCV